MEWWIETIKACEDKHISYKKTGQTFKILQSMLDTYVKINTEPKEIVERRLKK